MTYKKRISRGKVVTDSDIEKLADEAESGYDVTQLKKRVGRHQRNHSGSFASLRRIAAQNHAKRIRFKDSTAEQRCSIDGWASRRRNDPLTDSYMPTTRSLHDTFGLLKPHRLQLMQLSAACWC